MNHFTDGGLLVGGVFAGLSACAMDGISPRSALYVALSGHWVYGRDRALDGKCEPTARDVALLVGSFAGSLALLVSSGPQTAAVVPLQIGVPIGYVPFKRTWPLLKPAYVAAGWTCASVGVPCLMDHRDADPGIAAAMFMLSWAESTRMDCDDIEEDTEDGIWTLPARIGPRKTGVLCDAVALGGAALVLATCPTPPSVGRIAFASSAAAPALRRGACALSAALLRLRVK